LTVERSREENLRVQQIGVGPSQVLNFTLELLEASTFVQKSSGRELVSTWVFRTHVLSVSGGMPKNLLTTLNVAHSDG
jgi:lipid II:glycine glycyltransferase (peptidoglycan interpeptide bridge formation enzyme)